VLRRDRPLRLAFLTPVFVTDGSNGGLASYVNNITRACTEAGHQAEVFVLSWEKPGTIDHNGVRVHSVPFEPTAGWIQWARRIPNIKGLRRLHEVIRMIARAKQLASAFESRNSQEPFDLVQSTDLWATGMAIRPRRGLAQLVRCSNPIELYHQFEPKSNPRESVEWRVELRVVGRAPIVYAPSKLTADYYARRLQRPVHVCRPPAFHDPLTAGHPQSTATRDLPPKYLIHFGDYLGVRKGTQWLAKALPLAWRHAPDLTLVIAGRFFDVEYRELQALWDEKDRAKVVYLGRLAKSELFDVVRGARAAVLPSLVDNLPNCVYESLRMGIPVIGTRGASINELVEDGLTGDLVEALDEIALAEKMVAHWRGQSLVPRGFSWDSPIAKLMEPQAAVESLLKLAGLSGHVESPGSTQPAADSVCV
jgi:glycosyltransferase involved in cell wall biosynthesis